MTGARALSYLGALLPKSCLTASKDSKHQCLGEGIVRLRATVKAPADERRTVRVERSSFRMRSVSLARHATHRFRAVEGAICPHVTIAVRGLSVWKTTCCRQGVA